MAGRPTTASRAGLDAKLTHQKDGTWTISLVDDQGTEVFRKAGYKTEDSAKSSASYWVQRHYQVDTQETPTRPDRKPKQKSLGPTVASLAPAMRARADHNEEQSIALRAQADELEMEAKRLREAADTLDGPYGQT